MSCMGFASVLRSGTFNRNGSFRVLILLAVDDPQRTLDFASCREVNCKHKLAVAAALVDAGYEL
jgi:hypothetical protein